VKLDK